VAVTGLGAGRAASSAARASAGPSCNGFPASSSGCGSWRSSGTSRCAHNDDVDPAHRTLRIRTETMEKPAGLRRPVLGIDWGAAVGVSRSPDRLSLPRGAMLGGDWRVPGLLLARQPRHSAAKGWESGETSEFTGSNTSSRPMRRTPHRCGRGLTVAMTDRKRSACSCRQTSRSGIAGSGWL
jgi:hypothetical protein